MVRQICGKILKSGSMGVSCATCNKDEFAIYCLDCFVESQHIGHKYQYKQVNGMCDCGFKFSIKEECFCPKHIGAHKKLDMEEIKKHVNLDQAARWVFCLFETYFRAAQNNDFNVASKTV